MSFGKIWSFQEQLAKGQAWERELRGAYHRPVLQFESRDCDAVDGMGNRIEIKTESRTLACTPNFFVERIRDVEKGRYGGPWAAMMTGTNHFIIFYPADGVYFLFTDLPALCREVLAWAKETKAVEKVIRNRGWAASGYAVPRERLVHLCQAYRIVNGKGVPFEV